MLPNERDAAYLWDMMDAARTICEFTKGMDLDQFLRDRRTQAAVERLTGIIGEAARRISDAYKMCYPEIPWRKIISQRNVLVHEYGDINQERMWVLVSKRIPELIELLTPLIPTTSPILEDENL